MELISERKRMITTRVGLIMGVTVNFNFENNIGEAPTNINASCIIPSSPPATPAAGDIVAPAGESCNINISRQASGQKSVSISGNMSIAIIYPVVEEIETELEIIAMEGVAV